jgi:hypothetical protein
VSEPGRCRRASRGLGHPPDQTGFPFVLKGFLPPIEGGSWYSERATGLGVAPKLSGQIENDLLFAQRKIIPDFLGHHQTPFVVPGNLPRYVSEGLPYLHPNQDYAWCSNESGRKPDSARHHHSNVPERMSTSAATPDAGAGGPNVAFRLPTTAVDAMCIYAYSTHMEVRMA